MIGFSLFEWATWSWIIDPSSWLVILLVAVGLGTVIFVHELGHFVVAKLCGVKCEKFYLGFGWRVWSFRWGETEYGIGAFPLGGYVKMLGQEDNPARLKEEIERAKAAHAGDSTQGSGEAADEVADEVATDVAAAEAALYDPRSYLAQSVPKRIAIISAGVIMNMIFAFLMAVVAYLVGVNEVQCEVGSLQPGDPAWQANVQPGDRMVEINGRPTYRFRDLFARIPLSGKDAGVPMRIERPGVAEPIELTLHPNRDRLLPVIGVGPPHTTALVKSDGWLGDDHLKPYVRGTPAACAEPPFRLGDKIVEIDGEAVETGPQLDEALSARRARAVAVTVQRARDDGATAERLTIDVSPRPMRRVGLVMEMGPITAVQEDSPAARAGLESDDVLVAMDGHPVGDPMTLPDRLWAKANQAAAEGASVPRVTLGVKRGGKTVDVPVTLRRSDAFETPSPLFPNAVVSVPSLGVAYEVPNRVAGVVPESPAAAAGVVAGDVLAKVTLLVPDEAALAREGLEPGDVKEGEADLSKNRFDWPRVFCQMQEMLPDSKMELEFEGGKKVTLVPVEASDWFNPERGFVFEPLQFKLRAGSFGEALRLGGAETLEQTRVMLRTIERLVTGQISAKVIGGPVMIARVAAASASRGFSDFLIFLTMISVMVAVVNFLPIPILDGGHFVFLVYEGIRGKPADERVQVALTYLGLILIVMLMIWAISLDVKLIPRD